MKLQITKTHIAEGIPHSASGCPIALALEDRLGTASAPSVGLGGLSVICDGLRRHYQVSRAAEGFIRRFDRGDVTDPCELILNIRPLGTRR